MKKTLGIALIVFVIASVAFGTTVNGLLRSGRFSWEGVDLHWSDRDVPHVDIEEEIRTLPVKAGDQIRVSTEYGTIRVRQDDTLSEEVRFALSGRIPENMDYRLDVDKTGDTASYTLDVPTIRLDGGFGKREHLDLTVLVPDEPVFDLTLSTNLGKIDVNGAYGDVSIHNDLGAVELYGAVKELFFRLNLGDADIDLYDFERVDGAVDLGSIRLTVDDDVDLQGLGVDLDVDLGHIERDEAFRDTMSGEDIRLSTNLGDIRVERREIHE